MTQLECVRGVGCEMRRYGLQRDALLLIRPYSRVVENLHGLLNAETRAFVRH
jgi:hypothetical protein